jgi:hypothetical protein
VPLVLFVFVPVLVSFPTVSKPENDDFRIDTTFTGRDVDYSRPIGIVVAILAIILIVATMTTNVAAWFLPMSDDYLQVMVPVAPDGGEPLGLTSLMEEISDKTISITGSVMNRADRPMSNIVAILDIQDTTGRFPQTFEIPLMPVDLEPQATASFMVTATLQEKPGRYVVKFRFAEGPFISHKDDRAPAVTITPQPVQPTK